MCVCVWQCRELTYKVELIRKDLEERVIVQSKHDAEVEA